MLKIAFALAVAAGTASGELVVSEIWPGGLPGSEATSDWFEITNLGNTDVSLAGAFYDDDSADPTKDDALVGVGTVGAGESVIFMVSWEDDFNSAADAIDAFTMTWGAGNLAGVQIGWVDGGSGLGGGGDEVFIFDGNGAGANTLASSAYGAVNDDPASFIYNPNTGVFGERAQVGVFGAFASALDATPDVGSAIGSPGAIPTPGAAAVLSLAGLALTRRRR
jgi:hypothetical protein